MTDSYNLPETPQTAFTPEPVEFEKPKSNRTLWIVLIAVLILLMLCCCCVAGVLFYGIASFNFDWSSLTDTLNQMIY